MNTFRQRLRATIHDLANINDYIDTQAAADSIRGNIYFKGPNVWILAFSIIIASVGLNVNSTAVIIGAMLISPLMGPIIGIGLGLGINDALLLKDALKNLLIMVIISLVSSFVYFLITPLSLANPTELLSRTNPTIYDILIALFGGLAGIFEISKKDKGTVLSGVAIATALMPPLCTAGFGLAKGNLHYFLGALLLFSINATFIILATYATTKYLNFKEVEFKSEKVGRRTRAIITAVVIAVTIPSIWSAFNMIRSNRFEDNVAAFVRANRVLDKSYIYDYQADYRHGGSVDLFIAGGALTPSDKEALMLSAADHGLSEARIDIKESFTETAAEEYSDKFVKGLYERTDMEISKRDIRIKTLEAELDSIRQKDIPYKQLAKELKTQYPEVAGVSFAQGASVPSGSESESPCTIVIAETSSPLSVSNLGKMRDWLNVRLQDSTVVVIEKRVK